MWHHLSERTVSISQNLLRAMIPPAVRRRRNGGRISIGGEQLCIKQ